MEDAIDAIDPTARDPNRVSRETMVAGSPAFAAANVSEPPRDRLITAGKRRIAGLDWLRATRAILRVKDLL